MRSFFMENYKPLFLQLSRREQKSSLEAVIFASEEPISAKAILKVLIAGDARGSKQNIKQETDEAAEELLPESRKSDEPIFTHLHIDELISEINSELLETHRPFQIINIAGGYQFATRPEYGELLQQLIRSKTKRRLSQAAMECLAVIAYRQPATKQEVELVRGVNSGEVINALIEKNLVEILGRKDVIGKPLLYGTTNEFLKAFGLRSLEDLPKLRELEEISETLDREQNIIDISLDVEPEMSETLVATGESVDTEISEQE